MVTFGVESGLLVRPSPILLQFLNYLRTVPFWVTFNIVMVSIYVALIDHECQVPKSDWWPPCWILRARLRPDPMLIVC